MANLIDINNKLNEFKTSFEKLKLGLPTGFDEQKKQLDTIINFATDRLSSKYAILLNQGELAQIFNTINVITSEINNFNSSKNAAYITRSINQIVNLKNQLNLIPIENLDKSDVKRLTSELKTAKDNQAEWIQKTVTNLDNEAKNISDLITKANSLNDIITKNLSNSTTIALSSQFEQKRKEENGGLPYKTKKGETRYRLWGTYQKSSIQFVGIILLIIIIFLSSDKIIEWLLNIKFDITKDTFEQSIIRIISKLTILTPLIWLAWAQNKKMNLSKKLAEEYWHKEIVAKTFVGMSEQIENINSNTKETLKNELLSMTLTAISKNPAECIDNSNKSDHPINNTLKVSRKYLDNLNRLLDTAEKAKKMSL